jgi:phosphoglycerate dehydrogenase-like enzyme
VPEMLAAVTARTFETIAAAAPPGVEVRALGDGVALDGVGFLLPDYSDRRAVERLGELPALEVVQLLSAGTDWIERRVPAGVVLCNSRGSRDVPVAEWVLGALLGAQTGLLYASRARRWESWQPRELLGARVVILGMGAIGAAVAARLAPFGAEVVGIASRARPGVLGVDALADELPRADALVVLTPLTDATRGLVGAAELAALPDGSIVANAARGPVLDADALLAEAASGRLRVVVDVTDPEPLPADHPLWSARGTLAITPHVAGDTPQADERAARFAALNLGRWARGEPLEAVVRAG